MKYTMILLSSLFISTINIYSAHEETKELINPHERTKNELLKLLKNHGFTIQALCSFTLQQSPQFAILAHRRGSIVTNQHIICQSSPETHRAPIDLACQLRSIVWRGDQDTRDLFLNIKRSNHIMQELNLLLVYSESDETIKQEFENFTQLPNAQTKKYNLSRCVIS